MLRCPREVAPFLGDILRVAVAFMRYDPNYSYDDEDEAESSGDDAHMSVDGGEGACSAIGLCVSIC